MAYLGKYEGFGALSEQISVFLLDIARFQQRHSTFRLIGKICQNFIGNIRLIVDISLAVIPKVQPELHRKYRYS